MYKISKIISNLHDNGEVNLFLLSGEITLNGYIINITTDSDGNLKITKRIPCYNAILKNNRKMTSLLDIPSVSTKIVTGREALINISRILMCAYSDKAFLEDNGNIKGKDSSNDTAVADLYNIISSMLSLDNLDLLKLAMAKNICREGILADTACRNIHNEGPLPANFEDLIDEKCTELEKHYADIKKALDEGQASKILTEGYSKRRKENIRKRVLS